MELQTEFEFTLPKGYLDETGTLHKSGTMRLATALDEVAPLRDPRVRANEAYLALILLSQVITRLGSLTKITPTMIENFFAVDIAYLQEFYRQIDGIDELEHKTMTCPNCNHVFEVETPLLGGS
jgi:hypothetical protein